MSDEEDLLRRLAEAAREDEAAEGERLDGRWDALSAGDLPPAEAEALRREAETSMATREAYEAFSPLGAEFRSRMVEDLKHRLKPEPSQGSGPITPAKVRTQPRRASGPGALRRRWLPWAAAALAAASLVVFLRPSGEQAPLPEYALSLEGALREMRSAEPEAPPTPVPVFAPGNRFELVLTPRQPVDGRVAVQVLAGRDGDLRVLPVPVERSEQGAVRIAGRVGDEIELPAGESTLLVAVGYTGSLPSTSDLAALLASSDHAETDRWSAWKLRVAVAEGP